VLIITGRRGARTQRTAGFRVACVLGCEDFRASGAAVLVDQAPARTRAAGVLCRCYW
jgi:hypothetical protein